MGLWQRCHLAKCPAQGTYSISNVSIIRRKTRSLPLHCSESSGIYVNRIKRGTDMCRACTLCHFPHVVLYKYCLTESHNDLQQRAQRGCSTVCLARLPSSGQLHFPLSLAFELGHVIDSGQPSTGENCACHRQAGALDCQCTTLTHMPFPLPPSKVPLQLVGPWSLLGWSPRRPEHIPAH